MCAVCVDSGPGCTTHVVGDFNNVFSNSDPVNCPIIECKVRNACATNSVSSGNYIMGNSGNDYRATYKACGGITGVKCYHCKTAFQSKFYMMGMTS